MDIFLGSKANIFKNTHGGWYHHGKEISMKKKVAIKAIHCDFLCSQNRPPSIQELARKAKISTTYSSKIIKEIKETGHFVPVSILKKGRANKNPQILWITWALPLLGLLFPLGLLLWHISWVLYFLTRSTFCGHFTKIQN